jgi:hypothetical protein
MAFSMSNKSTLPTQTLAVILLVDTSIQTAQQWFHILNNYIEPLFIRLQSLHPTANIQVGLVTYGKSTNMKDPLSSRIFWVNPDSMLDALRNNPGSLGLGQSGDGGKAGLAILESFVCALEVPFSLSFSRTSL